MVTFSDLAEDMEEFIKRHSGHIAGGDMMFRKDVLKLVQKAVEHGEGKDQSKIGGILTSAVQMFLKSKG